MVRRAWCPMVFCIYVEKGRPSVNVWIIIIIDYRKKKTTTPTTTYITSFVIVTSNKQWQAIKWTFIPVPSQQPPASTYKWTTYRIIVKWIRSCYSKRRRLLFFLSFSFSWCGGEAEASGGGGRAIRRHIQ